MKQVHSTNISYPQYLSAVACIGKPDNQVEAFSLPKPLQQFIEDAKTSLQEIADATKLGLGQLLKAFASRNAWRILKAIGFNLKTLAKSLIALSRLLSKGLIAALSQLAASDLMDKLRNKLIDVNAVLDQYPILKALGKVALAGLLFWMWMNSAFIGDFEYDFDLQMVVDAFSGKYTVVDFLTEPSGLGLLATFSLGFIAGLGVPWLATSTANLLLGLCFTLFKKARQSNLAHKIRPLLSTRKTR